MQWGGGGRYSDIFPYICRLGSFFWFKSLNFNIFVFFQSNEYYLGYEDFVDIFWGHLKIGLYLGVISMHDMVFA